MTNGFDTQKNIREMGEDKILSLIYAGDNVKENKAEFFIEYAKRIVKCARWDLGELNPKIIIKNPNDKNSDLRNDIVGYYSANNNELVISELFLNDIIAGKSSLWDFVDTVLHEWAHFLQHLFVYVPEQDLPIEARVFIQKLKDGFDMPSSVEDKFTGAAYKIYRKYNNVGNCQSLDEFKDLFLLNYKMAAYIDKSAISTREEKLELARKAIEGYVQDLKSGNVKNSYPFIIKTFKKFLTGQLGSDWMIKDDKIIKDLEFAGYSMLFEEEDARIRAGRKHLELIFKLIRSDSVDKSQADFLLYEELPKTIEYLKKEKSKRETYFPVFNFFIDELEGTIRSKQLSREDMLYLQKFVSMYKTPLENAKRFEELYNKNGDFSVEAIIGMINSSKLEYLKEQTKHRIVSTLKTDGKCLLADKFFEELERMIGSKDSSSLASHYLQNGKIAYAGMLIGSAINNDPQNYHQHCAPVVKSIISRAHALIESTRKNSEFSKENYFLVSEMSSAVEHILFSSYAFLFLPDGKKIEDLNDELKVIKARFGGFMSEVERKDAIVQNKSKANNSYELNVRLKVEALEQEVLVLFEFEKQTYGEAYAMYLRGERLKNIEKLKKVIQNLQPKNKNHQGERW